MPTLEIVQKAVAQLHAEGTTVSIEAVRAITGGSPRDLGPLLQQIREGTAAPAPAGPRLTWPAVLQAAQAVRRERQQNIWTASDPAPTVALVVDYFYGQRRFPPPIQPLEVWEALQDAVSDPHERTFVVRCVTAMQRGAVLWRDTIRELEGIWKQLIA